MVFSVETLSALKGGGRVLSAGLRGDELLGPLALLPGVWKNAGGLEGRGWNMIALPFATRPGSTLDYRLLLNQYDETLVFDLVDKGVPNRGLSDTGTQADQSLVALDYEQVIDQIATADSRTALCWGRPTRPAIRSTTSRGCGSTCSTMSSTASTSPGWVRSRMATRSWRSAAACRRRRGRR